MRLQVLGVHIDGGMCERIVVPEENLYPAGTLSLRDAAMVEFLAIGAHAVRRSELAAAATARWSSAPARSAWHRALRPPRRRRRHGHGRRREAARLCRERFRHREDHPRRRACRAQQIERLTGGDFFDVVFDATGNARAMEASFGLVAHGGTLVMVGVLKADITFSDAEFHKREMTVLATRNATREDFESVMAAIGAASADRELITHRTTLAGAVEDLPRWAPEKAAWSRR